MGTLIRNSFFSAISLGLRFLSNALLFIIIARVLGVEEFGRLAFAVSFTGIFLVIVDYGFNLLIVREVAIAPGEAIPISNRVISGKILLSIISTAIIAVTVAVLGYPRETQVIIGILWVAAMLYSFGLFFNTIFRGLNQFQYETYPTILLHVAQFTLVVVLLALHYRTLAIACVYLVSRLSYFLVSYLLVVRKIGRLSFTPDFSAGWKILHESLPFGIHAILATLYFQIDTVFLSFFKGNAEVGYYQAAMRIVLASMLIYDIISTAYYPLIARKFRRDAAGFRKDGYTFNKYMLLIGGAIASFLLLNSATVIRLLYGPTYGRSVIIMELLAIIIFLRFAGASYAIFITVADNQRLRAYGVAVSLIVNVALNLYLIPAYGGVGAALASIATHLVLDGIYIFCAFRLTKDYFIDAYCARGLVVLGAASVACFVLKSMPILSIAVFVCTLVGLIFIALDSQEKLALRGLINKLTFKEARL